MSPDALRRRVLLSGTMLVAATVGYGRRAYAVCANSGGSTYQCSAANAATQTITANNAAVSTVAGFSVNAAAGNGITITGDGALSYTDINASQLTAAAGTALYVRSTADNGGTSGSVTINTDGALTGNARGILARTVGTGALAVTANGNVTGTAVGGIGASNSAVGTTINVTTGLGTTVSGSSYGIYANGFGTGALTITANGNVTGSYAINARNFSGTSTDLGVTTGTGTTVSGAAYGIIAYNQGTGTTTITANGNVTGASGTGINTRNTGTGTALTVTTGPGTTVSGAAYGIIANNQGTGTTTITANGNVTGATGNGINASNSATGTALSVTTGAGTTISGANTGISARNLGTGGLTIIANGDVTGTSNRGIYAYNSATGTALSLTTGASTTVSGNSVGIDARNDGTGALTITTNGDVTSTGGTGIFALNSATGTVLSVTTGAGTTVSSGNTGIAARNDGTGALTITANGSVTGTSARGIYAYNSAAGTALSVITAAGTTVSGSTSGIFANNFGTGVLSVTVNGDVTGTAGRGIVASNASGTDLTVTTAAGTTVSATTTGIDARNFGTGALSVTVNGDVTGTAGRGIFASNSSGTDLTVTTAAGTTVSGSISGIFANNFGTGALTVTANGTVTGNIGISIAGAATVTVGGAGVVTGSGGTAIQFANVANRLELVTGAVINGNVLGGTGTDTLGLSGTGSGSFNVGQLTSFEAGQKTGSGTWTLTGSNTGITGFAVNGGTLAVNGSLASTAMTVNAGGTLGGTGTVGNTLISGGTFAPGTGTPGSSMTVNGTLGFTAASTYAVNLNPATSSFANVSGAATLGGATVNAIFANGSYIAKQYTILNAGSISGAFGTLANTNLPANFNNTLSYDATHAYLNLTLAFIAPPTSGLSGNQSNVGNALVNYFNTNGGIPLVFGGLTANGLSQASGQPGASIAQPGITAAGQFVNAIFDGAFGDGNGQGGAIGFAVDDDEANAYVAKRKSSPQAKEAYAAVTPRDRLAPSFASRWNVWASAYGGNSRVSGDASAGTSTTTSRIFGMVAGASYYATPNTKLGFALGGAGSSFNLDGGFGSGKADIFNAAMYAKHNFGAAYVAGLLGYSWQDTTTDRTVTISGTDQLHASFKAQALTARLESGWRYATLMAGVTPYGALQSTTFYLPSYGETATSGSNTFALSYASKTVTATRSELGAKFDKAMLVQSGVFTLKAKTAWAHDWNTDRAATATFQTLPGATFAVNGAQASANAALLSLGAEMGWHNGWTLAGSFDGEFSRTTRGYAGKGSVKYAW